MEDNVGNLKNIVLAAELRFAALSAVPVPIRVHAM